ncbi:hypothetical protein PS691_01651 [Pseudomonas fluorescens]|uniref:Uncharacterized protein n=1 Tax=Pseudomonas fluorescens TaxID=294 RepID=A0A5E7BU97_PSEFL|nr:hypothetical protein PS691_01651 [Pseudomonas fluorescens]
MIWVIECGQVLGASGSIASRSDRRTVAPTLDRVLIAKLAAGLGPL